MFSLLLNPNLSRIRCRAISMARQLCMVIPYISFVERFMCSNMHSLFSVEVRSGCLPVSDWIKWLLESRKKRSKWTQLSLFNWSRINSMIPLISDRMDVLCGFRLSCCMRISRSIRNALLCSMAKRLDASVCSRSLYSSSSLDAASSMELIGFERLSCWLVNFCFGLFDILYLILIKTYCQVTLWQVLKTTRIFPCVL